jgi:hypothetical protein
VRLVCAVAARGVLARKSCRSPHLRVCQITVVSETGHGNVLVVRSLVIGCIRSSWSWPAPVCHDLLRGEPHREFQLRHPSACIGSNTTGGRCSSGLPEKPLGRLQQLSSRPGNLRCEIGYRTRGRGRNEAIGGAKPPALRRKISEMVKSSTPKSGLCRCLHSERSA